MNLLQSINYCLMSKEKLNDHLKINNWTDLIIIIDLNACEENAVI